MLDKEDEEGVISSLFKVGILFGPASEEMTLNRANPRLHGCTAAPGGANNDTSYFL